jgi:16S rRNA (cytosine967-C5)-methyltransferase
MDTGEKSKGKEIYFHRYVSYAASLLSNYNGETPFHLYLKQYFSANKKHGSGDRRIITSLCYDRFRLGLAVSASLDTNEQILLSYFLIETKPSSLLAQLKPEWNEKIELPVAVKLQIVKNLVDQEKIFPFSNELSDQIDQQKFSCSFLNQPKLFIRIRPGFQHSVTNKLSVAEIPFEKISELCLAFSNKEKVNAILDIDREAVIQDYNSQRTGDFLIKYFPKETPGISVWDCCAASGGKSILAFDLLKNIKLTVTDTRKNILENLKLRFLKAGIKNYESFVANLSAPFDLPLPEFSPDLIIADVPCSGSGTWGRTPEQLSYFSKKSISKYASVQQNIVQNAAAKLKAGGYFLYITCSVFKLENEENIDFIQKQLQLKLVENKYLKGYEMQADTLFAALFIKE